MVDSLVTPFSESQDWIGRRSNKLVFFQLQGTAFSRHKGQSAKTQQIKSEHYEKQSQRNEPINGLLAHLRF